MKTIYYNWRVPRMDTDNTADLIQRAQQGEQNAQLAIIDLLKPVILRYSYSSRFRSSGWVEDAKQECRLSILEAITKWDVVRGDKTSFRSFAIQYIKHNLESLYNNYVAAICKVPQKPMREYYSKKQKENLTTLKNGMRVDDLERLLSYTELQVVDTMQYYALSDDTGKKYYKNKKKHE